MKEQINKMDKGFREYSKNSKISDDYQIEAVKNSKSIAGVLRYIGKNPKSSGQHDWLKKRIIRAGIDTSHFTGQGWNAGNVCYKTDEVFAEGSRSPRGQVRKWVIRDNLIPYECAFCGNQGEWQGKPMALELDHINGVFNDHRLANLRFLCPNCHAVTDTYCGKNKKDRKEKTDENKSMECAKKHQDKSVCAHNKERIMKKPRKAKQEYFCKNCGKRLKSNVDYCRPCSQRRVLQRPSAIEIAQKVKEKGFLRGAKDYGVTDNAVRKWCKEYGIPTHTKDLISWLDSQDQ